MCNKLFSKSFSCTIFKIKKKQKNVLNLEDLRQEVKVLAFKKKNPKISSHFF